MGQYQSNIKTPEDQDKKKRQFRKQQVEARSQVRSLRIATSKLRIANQERMKIEEDLREELEAVKDSNKRLKKQYDTEFITAERSHRIERRNLMDRNRELRNTLRALRKTTTTSMKKMEEAMERERTAHEQEKDILMRQVKDLQQEMQSVKNHLEEQIRTQERTHCRDLKFYRTEKRHLKMELEAVKVANQKLLRDLDYRTMIKEEELMNLRTQNQDLQEQLAALKAANQRLFKELDYSTTVYEEEQTVLRNQNRELQQLLAALKASIPDENMDLDFGISLPQQGLHCARATTDDGKVSLENFEFVTTLGEGSFGKVVLATGPLLGGPERLCAIKAVKKGGMTSHNISEVFTEKRALMLTADHPFITTLYACFQNKDHLFFVMEYVNGGDLWKLLTKAKVFSQKRVQFYAAEITLALQFLHQLGIVHRDLKLENVLVGRDGHCRVSDFGLSKIGLSHQDRTSSCCGTPHYMAPEMLKGLPYGHSVDWWALGIMVYEMLTGSPPYDFDDEHHRNGSADDDDGDEEEEEKKLFAKIINDQVQYPDDMSLAAMSLVSELLRKDPAERLGADGSVLTVRQHLFFDWIDWKALERKQVEPPEKPEDTFKKVLPGDANPCTMDDSRFKGFSCINYDVQHG